MSTVKNKFAVIGAAILAIVFLATSLTYAEDERDAAPNPPGSRLEVHIQNNGNVIVQGAKVLSITGSSFTAATTWDAFTLTWTVNTDARTKIMRRFDAKSSLGEVSVGDYVTFHGKLVVASSSPPTVLARYLKDWSIQKRRGTFLGSITSINASASSFVLATEERGNQTVLVSSSTKMVKGDTEIGFGDLAAGNRAQISGIWNNLQNTVEAEHIKIFVKKAIARRVFEGTLKSISSSITPSSLVVTISAIDYTVPVVVEESVLINRNWERALLSQLTVGDKMRIYGVAEGTTITPTVIRDVSLR